MDEEDATFTIDDEQPDVQPVEDEDKTSKPDNRNPTSPQNLLPEGWIRLRHSSGVTVYLHRTTRVLTLSRPYSIGAGSARHHRIPLYAIPCLAYKREAQTASSAPIEQEATCPATAQLLEESQDGTNTDTQASEADREEGEVSSFGEDDDDDDEATASDAKKPRLMIPTPIVDVSVVTIRSGTFSSRRRRRRRPAMSISDTQVNEAVSILTDTTEQETPNSATTDTVGDNSGSKEQGPTKCNIPSYRDVDPNCVVLTHDQVHHYCKPLLQFRKKEATASHRFAPEKSFSDQTKSRLLGLSDEAKVIRYQLPPIEGDPSRSEPKEGLINLTGKSYVCILHEYCQNVLRRPPTYQTVTRENDSNPYELTVVINGQPYATGVGPSKKQARLEAAKQALSLLIPDFDKIMGSDSSTATNPQSNNPSESTTSVPTEKDLQLFDDIKLSDPRIGELSLRMSLPQPYNLLIECLNRSCIPESELKSTMSTHGRTRHSFTLQLRQYLVKVPCKNKREGRHLAAQLMLGRIHPELDSWGAVLRMYGPGSKPDKRGELETIQGAQNQEKSAVKMSLIRLLKSKMLELAEQWEKNDGQRKGKFFVPPDNLPVVTFHPDSKTDLYSSVPALTSSPTSQE